MSFELPSNNHISDQDGRTSMVWLQWFTLAHSTITAARQSGATADRPVKLLWVGRRYFDTDLGIPVYLKSVRPDVWVDSAGTTV